MINNKVKILTEGSTNFPIISLPDVPFDMMWLPFTRIQLEFFLSDVNDVRFDASWYANIVSKGNPRTSPNQINSNNVNGILATNILLREARQIADWFSRHDGYAYEIPTAEEWEMMVNACKEQSIIPLDDIPSDIDPRARVLLHRLNEINTSSNLAEQMMLGWERISEYVYQDNLRQTCQITGGSQGNFTQLIKSLDQVGDRQTYLTFRLIRQTP